LTNGFNKKVENLIHAAALHFVSYNFARGLQTLRVTPCMEKPVSQITVREIVEMAQYAVYGGCEGELKSNLWSL
jgi:hypothetical protein